MKIVDANISLINVSVINLYKNLYIYIKKPKPHNPKKKTKKSTIFVFNFKFSILIFVFNFKFSIFIFVFNLKLSIVIFVNEMWTRQTIKTPEYLRVRRDRRTTELSGFKSRTWAGFSQTESNEAAVESAGPATCSPIVHVQRCFLFFSFFFFRAETRTYECTPHTQTRPSVWC